MMPKKYAEGTTVPIAKSKGDIDKLLRDWGCDRIAWEEDFRAGVITLRFVWTKNEASYAARLSVRLPTLADIRERKDVRDGRNGRINENRVQAALEKNGRPEMRLLLLWLKAAFNAVEAGLLEAETLFLPFFVNAQDESVSDIIIPNLPALMAGKAHVKLLGR